MDDLILCPVCHAPLMVPANVEYFVEHCFDPDLTRCRDAAHLRNAGYDQETKHRALDLFIRRVRKHWLATFTEISDILSFGGKNADLESKLLVRKQENELVKRYSKLLKTTADSRKNPFSPGEIKQ